MRIHLVIPKISAAGTLPMFSSQPNRRLKPFLAAAAAGGLTLLLVWWFWFASPGFVWVEPTAAVALPGTQANAVVSPDGTTIAFSWKGPGDDNWDIYLTRIGTGEQVRITDSPDIELYPAWSSDSRFIAYVQLSERQCGIFKAPVSGGPATRLCESSPFARGLAWDSSSGLLAVSDKREESDNRHILLIDTKTGQRRKLAAPPVRSSGDLDPVFSPDGSRVAFRRIHSYGRHELLTAAVNGTGFPKPLIRGYWGQINGHAYGPGGDRIVFCSNRGGRFELWQLSVSGGDPIRLPVMGHQMADPSAALTGTRMIYRDLEERTRIFGLSLSLDGVVDGAPEPLFSTKGSERYPRIGPGGTHLAFASSRDGHSETFLGNLGDGTVAKLEKLRQHRAGFYRWSPDGKALVFTSLRSGEADLWSLDWESSALRRLTFASWDETNGVFSRDGAWIYFASNRDGHWRIQKIPAEGGKAQLVAAGFLAEEGPGDGFLYVLRLESPADEGAAIWRRPLAGGSETRVLAGIELWDWASWAVRSSGIYFLDRNPTRIVRFDFASKKVLEVYEPRLGLPFFGPALDVSQTEDRLYLCQVEESDDAVMVAAFPK